MVHMKLQNPRNHLIHRKKQQLIIYYSISVFVTTTISLYKLCIYVTIATVIIANNILQTLRLFFITIAQPAVKITQ